MPPGDRHRMAAITTLFLRPAELSGSPSGLGLLYGPTEVVIESRTATLGMAATLVDTSNLSNIEPALRPTPG